MSFLPQSHEVPQTGNYMKLATGKNRFRVLSSAVVGNLFWRSKGEGREPVRRRMNEPIAANELEYNTKTKEQEKVKHFWAFAVYNYAAKAVQILELTQKSVMMAIQGLVEEADWGDPTHYDIIVTRTGSGLETEYAVQPAPAKPIDPAIAEAYRSVHPNLEALFSGADPFSSNGNGAASPPPVNSAATIAKANAWKAYNGKFPESPKDEIAEGWKQSFASYFPGKKPELITAAEWDKFVADKFVKVRPSPISDVPIFNVDDPNSPDFVPF